MPYSTDESCNYDLNETQLQEIVAFLNNGEEKILRNPNGGAMTVITTDASYKYIDEIAHRYNGGSQQPSTIKFRYVEIGAPPE